MQWSKIKRNVEALFADSVKGRVGLYTTRYRTMHDHDGRAWITLDGKEIINMTHIWQWLYELQTRAGILAGDKNYRSKDNYKQYDDMAEKILMGESIFVQFHLGRAMYDYPNMAIESIMKSDNPIIRAIGMFDRRIGLRRLRDINIATEHPLVVTTYYFRCEAEGIRTENN
jgi:hypothetical protein